MGNVAGALGRFTLKKARRFNVESRTERYLEKNIKNPAPKPIATQREVEQITQDMPDLMEKINERNEELLSRLKNVYVSSEDPPLDKIKANFNPNRPLPFERKSDFLEYSYVEPESVPPGKLTLKLALQLLSKHQVDKEKNDIKSLAVEYNLNESDVGNIVDYFKVYTLVDNDTKESSFDVNPYTIVENPIDKIPISISNLPEESASFQKNVNKRAETVNQEAEGTPNKNSKNK